MAVQRVLFDSDQFEKVWPGKQVVKYLSVHLSLSFYTRRKLGNRDMLN